MKFNFDNGFFRFLGSLVDLFILNLLTAVCCIPIVTAGAAFTAMHYCLIRMNRGEESYIFTMFFKSFKENFKPATILWLIRLALSVIIYMDFQIVRSMEGQFANVMWCLILGLTVFLLFGLQFLFPMVARFEQTLKEYVKNSFLVSIGYFPRTVCMLIVEVAPLVLIYLYWELLLPLLIMWGITLPAMIKSKLYDPVFKKLEGKSVSDSEMHAGEGENLEVTRKEEE